jgi:hypothetical protein
MTALLDRLERHATRRNVLLLLAMFLVINAGLLPLAGERLEAYSGGVGPLDLRPAYTADEAYTSLAAYGDEGRRFYLLLLLTVDLIYPVVYSLFFSLTIVYCLRQVLAADHTLQRAALLPWVSLLADFVENAGLAWLLLNYPNRLDGVAVLTSTVTTIKWIFTITFMAATAAGLAGLVLRRLRSRSASRA